ncbi:MAG: substrate-binding domain-containing protein [Pseudobutyrivibrio sp.]|nr:substrate-binding domain-containing protein [Pseudobutyrivibrio sp.]
MRNKRLFVGFSLALLLLISIETYIYINNSEQKKEDVKLSFVLTGDNLDKWENLVAGAETAAIDEDCIVDFINSPVEYGFEGEVENIERQLDEGADYVMVASSDYQAMKEYVKATDYADKIVFVKNGLYKADKTSILTNDYQLGCDFGNYIIDNCQAKKLIMVSTKEDINTVEIREAIEETLKNSSINVEYRLMSATSGTLNQSMYNLGQSGLYNGFITLDNETMEAAAKAQSKLKAKVLVYSVDNSREAVYYLDSNDINAVAFEDDYSLGYLAVCEALDKKVSTVYDVGALYYITDKDSIHSEQMEKVLFPFVK